VTLPRAVAPRIPPGYGVPTDASGGERLPWSWAVERLAAARNYWICTTRPDGRPHASPVWGLWLDDAVWFSTAHASQKARNLARDASLVVHLESGDDVVVLEGEAVEERGADALARFLDAYEPKYGLRPDLDALDAAVFVLRPRIAYTWQERSYLETATRWLFGQ
jgi:PPOX class probable F420-dependent enzyme